ncbi:MAG: hypothetical protein JO042_13565, partial [Sinobacteraceae bacterium]|nr:hypothetical protein [Nevskiaceae bacterium]
MRRLELPGREGRSYVVVVTGKDHGDSNGLVDLRVINSRQASKSACLDAQKVLAKADAAYAAAQAVTRAVISTPGVSSDKSYQEAAAGYRNAATQLEVQGPSPLLAQAQLAEASLLNLDVDDAAGAKARAVLADQTYASLRDDYGKARAQAIEGAANADIAVSVKRASATDATSQVSTMLAEARRQLASVVAFHTRRQEFYDAGYAQNYIGLAFWYEARYDEAIHGYQKALPFYERLHDHAGQA